MANQKDNGDILKDMITPVTFNLMGKSPSMSVWEIPTDLMEKKILELCKEEIEEAQFVSFYIDRKGYITCAVWMNGSCKHFVNKKTVNTVLGQPLREYSNELKQFVSKFGDNGGNGNKATVGNCIVYPRDDNRDLVGIRIKSIKFIDMLFDKSGEGYNNAFNENRKITKIIEAIPHARSYKDNPYDSIEFFEIKVREKSQGRSGKAPRAIRNGKF